jgi:hypothetical protein
MEISLGIKCTAKEERKVTVLSLDNVGNPADRLTPMESVLVYEPIFYNVSGDDVGTKRLCHTRKKGRIHGGWVAGKWG